MKEIRLHGGGQLWVSFHDASIFTLSAEDRVLYGEICDAIQRFKEPEPAAVPSAHEVGDEGGAPK